MHNRVAVMSQDGSYTIRKFGQTIALLAMAFSCARMSNCQTVTAAKTRDPQALSVMQASIAAMTAPGSNGATPIASVTASGSMEQAAPKGEWKAASFEYSDSLSLSDHEYKREITMANGKYESVSNHGQPKRIYQNATTPIRPSVSRTIVADYVPLALLSSEIGDSAASFQYFGLVTTDGRSLVHISISQAGKTPGDTSLHRDWFFDSSTSLPAFSITSLPATNNPFLYMTQVISYKSYQPCGSYLCPMEQTQKIGNTEVVRLHIKSVTISSTDLSPSIFTSEQ